MPSDVQLQQRLQERTLMVLTELAMQTGSAVLTRTRMTKRKRWTRGMAVDWA